MNCGACGVKNVENMASRLQKFRDSTLWANLSWRLWLVAWLAAIVLVAVIMLWRHGGTPQRHISDALRDSLLCVGLTAGQPTQLVRYEGYDAYFDSAWHIPACVVYELTRLEVTTDSAARTDDFMQDTQVDGCPTPKAYAGSNYNRGHMAPAGDMRWSARAMRESFYMTNICPQSRSLNEGAWARLEQKCREWTMRDSALIIAAGPIVTGDTTILASEQVVVPQRFYKVILAPFCSPMRMAAFIFDNAACNAPLKHNATTVAHVEQLTGIDFFAALPDDMERDLESRNDWDQWFILNE